jgi:hypothetical protein
MRATRNRSHADYGGPTLERVGRRAANTRSGNKTGNKLSETEGSWQDKNPINTGA